MKEFTVIQSIVILTAIAMALVSSFILVSRPQHEIEPLQLVAGIWLVLFGGITITYSTLGTPGSRLKEKYYIGNIPEGINPNVPVKMTVTVMKSEDSKPEVRGAEAILIDGKPFIRFEIESDGK